MSWATVCGLAIILAIAGICSWLWTDFCKRKEREDVEEAIDEVTEELENALRDKPDCVAEHLRLRDELRRLLEYRASL